MASIYNTGTVTVTNGSATVVGSGTAWALALVSGGFFSSAGLAIPILSVTDNTHLVLAYAWPGTTAAGATYAIDLQGSDVANVIDLNTTLSRVLVTLSLAGITPNSSGSLADQAALTLGMADKGYLFLLAVPSVAFAFYRWNGTGWDGPFPVANSVATGGVSSLVAGTNVSIDNTNPAIPVISASGTPIQTAIHGATAKSTLVDADEMGIADSAASYGLKKVLLSTVSAYIWAALGSLINGGTGKTTPVDADMFPIADSAASNATKKLTWANMKATLRANLSLREVLSANRTYYVGFNMGSAAVSIASPGVVTKSAHGLVTDSRVSFQILANMKSATVSVASPAVVTMANSFVAGQPVKFETSGRLPSGLVAGTTYFVIATGLSGSSFQISATVGGAAINTSNPTFTVTIAAPGVVTETAHGRATGNAIQLSTTGALPTGLAAATTYFLNVIDANTYNLRLTPEGANITTTGTQSGTHSIVQFGAHSLLETGTLPTGITAGQDYFVLATGLTTNTFQFASTSGGAAINTTGSTTGTITLKTGSDSNAGLGSASAANSFLTIQKALDTISGLDLSVYNVIVQVQDGTYTGSVIASGAFTGKGTVTIQGNTTTPANVVWNTTSARCLTASAGCRISPSGIEFRTTTSGECIVADGPGSYITIGPSIRFGPCASAHVFSFGGGYILGRSAYSIVGGGAYHSLAQVGSTVDIQGVTITLSGAPAFTAFARSVSASLALFGFNTFSGYGTGIRYQVLGGSGVDVNGGGITYLPGSSAGTADAATYSYYA